MSGVFYQAYAYEFEFLKLACCRLVAVFCFFVILTKPASLRECWFAGNQLTAGSLLKQLFCGKTGRWGLFMLKVLFFSVFLHFLKVQNCIWLWEWLLALFCTKAQNQAAAGSFLVCFAH